MENFKVVELRILNTGDDNNDCWHQLYLKEHSAHISDENKPLGKTLFIVNIPPYINEENLRLIFGQFGVIINVELGNYDEIKNGFKTGYVVFSKKAELRQTLQTDYHLEIDSKHLNIGIAKWTKDYNNSISIINQEEKLSEEIIKFMKNYDKLELEQNKSKKNNENDDEGWTVVTAIGRKPGLARKKNIELKIKENIEKKSKDREFKNFYTFQIKEGKKKNLAELRKNYEDAKKKIALMKSTRKFKPF